MKKSGILGLMLFFLAFGVSGVSATALLDDWAFNVDGATYQDGLGDTMPTTGALDSQGLGTLAWTTSVAGSHSFIAFFDHEISEVTTTWFNEYGDTANIPDVGQSWEIDEPGWSFGNIYEHVIGWNGTDYSGTIGLDNTNSVPSTNPDDVSWAIGWNFVLAADETGTITLVLADTAPTSGFYLTQTDVTTLETIYYFSTLEITGGPAPIPEPCTMLLVGTGLVGLFGLGRNKMKK